MNSSESINVLTVTIIFAFAVENGNASKYIMHITCNQI